jgi:hypothetical protein
MNDNNINNPENMNMVDNIIRQDNNMDININENNNIQVVEKISVSSNSQILRDKLMYNENDDKIYKRSIEPAEKENEPNTQNIEGQGYFVES